jgi:hypothetical protein
LHDPPAGDWLDYVRGTARVLADAGLVREAGFEIAVLSDLPEGAGLSSSAALEAATALALIAASGAPEVAFERAELSRLCQRAEQEFAGVPCGIMDSTPCCVLEPSGVVLDCARSCARCRSRGPVVSTGERALRSGGYAARGRWRALDGARGAGLPASLSEPRPPTSRASDALDRSRCARATRGLGERARARVRSRPRCRRARARRSRDVRVAREPAQRLHVMSESDALVEDAGRPSGRARRRVRGCTVNLVRGREAHLRSLAPSAPASGGSRATGARAPRLARICYETRMTDCDVVVAGAGIGGSALATVLARGGLSVLVLEKETEYRDRVRGEWLAPWGVVESKRLGLYGTLRAAGGHHLSEHRTYHDSLDAARTPLNTVDLRGLLPEVPGPLCLGHPTMCRVLSEAAGAAGAELLRGAAGIELGAAERGRRELRFEHAGSTHTVRCR